MSNKFMDTGYLHNGCGLIAAERVRQEQQLGWTAEHDDKHIAGDLALASRGYAGHAAGCLRGIDVNTTPPAAWPFEAAAWKPSSAPVKDLVKAGALIAAEIDRIYREFQKACNEITVRDFGFDCFDEMDAYELPGLPWIDIDPADFIREHFAEDYERLKYEHEQARQAEEEGGNGQED